MPNPFRFYGRRPSDWHGHEHAYEIRFQQAPSVDAKSAIATAFEAAVSDGPLAVPVDYSDPNLTPRPWLWAGPCALFAVTERGSAGALFDRVAEFLVEVHDLCPIADVVATTTEPSSDPWTRESVAEARTPLPGPRYESFDKRLSVYARADDEALGTAVVDADFEAAREKTRDAERRAKLLEIDAAGRANLARDIPAFVLSETTTAQAAPMAAFPTEFRGRARYIQGGAWSESGRAAVSVKDIDGDEFVAWTDNGTDVSTYPTPMCSVAIAPSGDEVLLSDNRGVRALHLESRTIVAELPRALHCGYGANGEFLTAVGGALTAYHRTAAGVELAAKYSLPAKWGYEMAIVGGGTLVVIAKAPRKRTLHILDFDGSKFRRRHREPTELILCFAKGADVYARYFREQPLFVMSL